MGIECGQIGMLDQQTNEHKGDRSSYTKERTTAVNRKGATELAGRIVQARVVKVAGHYSRPSVNAYYNPTPRAKHYGSETLEEMKQGLG